MITIDGSSGEGGGQILRTSLALSLITGQPCRFEKIRAGREKPGLKRQHLASVAAAAEISNAQVTGATLGSQNLEFCPGPVTPGNYRFAVGTAGSATLVFQTVLPALLRQTQASTLTLEGGTHNPLAPSYDFLAKAYVPLIERMGPQIALRLRNQGFFPAGGGKFHASIEPATTLKRVDLLERGAIRRRHARVLLSKLSESIADKQLAVVREKLGWSNEECSVEFAIHPLGPGSALVLEVETDTGTAVFTGPGDRDQSAEEIALKVIGELEQWLVSETPVDEHLADQLMLPMALAGGGSYRTTEPSPHSLTNAETIAQFLSVSIRVEQESALVWRAVVG
ncbi:MAG TPA: RNA 3'-terminal phosphate cyclase [Candidatus Limnocylindria bacterium]|jgi:RNA 3'-terminal phosphate cyclase (ATP)|nr:RNA 3'-terminal phosphate cyclase [Candidatus Limnocylindria bacterium]